PRTPFPYTTLFRSERETVGEKIGHRYAARGDELQRLPVVPRRGPVGADYGQLAVVDQVRVAADDRIILGQPSEQAHPTAGHRHRQRLLLSGLGGRCGDHYVCTAPLCLVEDRSDRIRARAVDQRIGLDSRGELET